MLFTLVKMTLSAPLVMRSSMPVTSLSAQQPKITTMRVVRNVLADGAHHGVDAGGVVGAVDDHLAASG